MNGIYFEQITTDDLRQIVSEEVRKAMAQKPLPRKLTREQVAEMAHITLATLHNWIRAGKLHPTKTGGRVLFDEEEVTNLLARR